MGGNLNIACFAPIFRLGWGRSCASVNRNIYVTRARAIDPAQPSNARPWARVARAGGEGAPGGKGVALQGALPRGKIAFSLKYAETCLNSLAELSSSCASRK